MSRDALCDFMDILLSLLRDALYEKLGKNTFCNIDAKAIKNRVAEHFTTAEIQGMIAETLETRRVLTEFGGAAGAALDGLLVSLRKWEKQ